MSVLLAYMQIVLLATGAMWIIAFAARLTAFIGTIFELKIGGYPLSRLYEFQAGCLIRWNTPWIGAHWSPYTRILYINLIPCVTVWITMPGGKSPESKQ